MTAVEWLDEKLQDTMFIQYGYVNGVRKVVMPLEDYMRLKQEAIELEKQQIIDAYDAGLFDGTMDDVNDRMHKQYYNETFK